MITIKKPGASDIPPLPAKAKQARPQRKKDELVVMGIDPSTYTGVVVLKGGELATAKVVTFPDAEGIKRLQLIATSVWSLVEEYQPDQVFIEGYAYGNKFSLVLMVEIGTVIRYSLYQQGRSWWNVPPTQLKKWVTGKGTAKKKDMATFVKNRWGFTSPSDDVVDAYALARLGWEHLSTGLDVKLTKGA